MIADFETNKLYLSSLIKSEKYQTFWTDLERILNNHRIKPEFIDVTRDLWCRDYMPVQVTEKEFVQFKYLPDYYLTHDFIDRLTIQKEMQYNKPHGINIKHVDLIVDGGNIVKNKSKAIMTKKVFEENKQRADYVVFDMLTKSLKVEELYFIPIQPYDLTGHSDGMVRFLDENTLLVNDFSKDSPSWRKLMDNALKLTGLEIIPFPYVYSSDKEDGEWTAKGCYINYAQIGNLIIFPKFNINEDGNALKKIKELYPEPEYHIETIDSNLIAKGGGVLNCLTWNIYKPIVEDAIDNLFPYADFANTIMVIHKDDAYKQLDDTVCVQVSLAKGEIGKAWSRAKTLKHVEVFNNIGEERIQNSKALLTKYFTSEQLSDILESLLYPTKEVIDELVYIPPRLKSFKPKT